MFKHPNAFGKPIKLKGYSVQTRWALGSTRYFLHSTCIYILLTSCGQLFWPFVTLKLQRKDAIQQSAQFFSNVHNSAATSIILQYRMDSSCYDDWYQDWLKGSPHKSKMAEFLIEFFKKKSSTKCIQSVLSVGSGKSSLLLLVSSIYQDKTPCELFRPTKLCISIIF